MVVVIIAIEEWVHLRLTTVLKQNVIETLAKMDDRSIDQFV